MTQPKEPIKEKETKKLKYIVTLLFSITVAILTSSLVLGQEDKKETLDDVYERSTGVTVTPVDDHTYLRRLSLHVRGTLPSLNEIQDMEKTKPERKRLRFSVQYLRDADFAHYWGTLFASMFREQSTGWKRPYGTFYKYLAESLHENKPYDQLITEMLTASGSPDKNPAVGFYLRDDGDPLQAAEYVGRTLYGKRVSCARCHDHPYDDFTRRDYFALAAFFSQQYAKWDWWANDVVEFEGGSVPWWGPDLRDGLSEKDKIAYEKVVNEWHSSFWNKLTDAQRQEYSKKRELTYGTLFYQPKIGIRFPRSDDEPGGDLVAPKFPDGKKAKIKEGEDRRAVFAAWLTDRSNDRFRKVIINRIWTKLMGWSFFTPMDDWNSQTKIQHPEILNHLDKVFAKKEYRIKDLILYIVMSDAYARSSPPVDSKQTNEVAYFQAKRLDADQLMNALIRGSGTMKVGDIWERRATIPITDDTSEIDLTGVGGLKCPKQSQSDFTNACEVERPTNYSNFLSVFGSGRRTDIADDEPDLTIEQVMTLMNGRLTGRIVWDFGNQNSFLRREYAKNQDMMDVYEIIFRGSLSRSMTEAERAKLDEITNPKFGTQNKNEFKQSAAQDLMWAIFNSQEFNHVR